MLGQWLYLRISESFSSINDSVILWAVGWSKRQSAVFLIMAHPPPVLLQAHWDSNPCCLPTLRPRSPSALGLSGIRSFTHSHPSLPVVQLLALGWTCPDCTFFLQKTGWGIIHNFKCFGWRFPQHLPFVQWILVTAQGWPFLPVLWRGPGKVKVLHSSILQKLKTLLCWDGFGNNGVSVRKSRRGRLLLETERRIFWESEEKSY